MITVPGNILEILHRKRDFQSSYRKKKRTKKEKLNKTKEKDRRQRRKWEFDAGKVSK